MNGEKGNWNCRVIPEPRVNPGYYLLERVGMVESHLPFCKRWKGSGLDEDLGKGAIEVGFEGPLQGVLHLVGFPVTETEAVSG